MFFPAVVLGNNSQRTYHLGEEIGLVRRVVEATFPHPKFSVIGHRLQRDIFFSQALKGETLSNAIRPKS